MMGITEVVRASNGTQQQTAKYSGTAQPRINDLFSSKSDKFSLDALVNINAELGQSISLVYQTA